MRVTIDIRGDEVSLIRWTSDDFIDLHIEAKMNEALKLAAGDIVSEIMDQQKSLEGIADD